MTQNASRHIGTLNRDRAHKKFKNHSRIEGNTQNIIQSEINFKYKRQLFKNTCNKKMRDNLYSEDDPGLMTKKFLSNVKSNSKSSRLPEAMYLDDTFRNKPSEKAELFNNYLMNNFLIHQTITLILIFQTIKYLISI